MSAATASSTRTRAPTVHWSRVVLLVTVLALVALPTVLPHRAIAMVTQMQIAALFALAFNILWRQTRLLSFGHAAFFGIGMFATIHIMRAVAARSAFLPLPLLPIFGLMSGLVLGVIVGFFATARTGTYFAMITLAFAEIIHQLSPQWEGIFGGESGLSSMRMAWAGLSFGSDKEVYYLVLVWCLAAMATIHYFTLTPLGRLAFALGDNEQRVRFLGYNAPLAKTFVFIVSAMFTGLAGGLLAIANENVDHTIFRASLSGQVVIHTFIGGAGTFLGPIVGAAAMTMFSSLAADLTRLWVLYQGLLFIAMVMYLPQGIVGLAVDCAAHWRWRELGPRLPSLLAVLGGIILLTAGIVFIAEFLAALATNPFARRTDHGVLTVALCGATWDGAALATWLLPLCSVAGGVILTRLGAAWLSHAVPAGVQQTAHG